MNENVKRVLAAAAEASTYGADALLKVQQEQRAESLRHRGTVNRKAADAFVRYGFDDESARKIVRLVAAGSVPAISITY